MSRVLIVHADDFNLTEGVNEGILRGHQNGIVTSTSVMTNLPGLDRSADLLRKNPTLDAGVHLNLTQGKPLADKVPSLVGEDGRFHKRGSVEPNLLNPDEVRREYRAQVDVLRTRGVQITHLDTHHHLHDSDVLFPIVLEVAAEYQLAVRSYGGKMAVELDRRGVRHPDRLIVEFYGEETVNEPFLLTLIEGLQEGVSELCCHPAQVDDALRAISSYSDTRARELALLTSESVKAAVGRERVRLAGYHDAFRS
ncbi:MAG: ChbG/HpnK family deacetylase [Candidatus Xenobia bacterium]